MPLSSSDRSIRSADQSLEAAYRAADYRVNGLLLKIGQPHPEFDRWLAQHHRATYYILTSHNPYSTVLPPAVNAARHRTLLQLLHKMQLPYVPAYGSDPGGQWVPEEGVCLLDVPPATGDQLGRIYEQHAVVYGDRAGVPLLHWL